MVLVVQNVIILFWIIRIVLYPLGNEQALCSKQVEEKIAVPRWNKLQQVVQVPDLLVFYLDTMRVLEGQVDSSQVKIPGVVILTSPLLQLNQGRLIKSVKCIRQYQADPLLECVPVDEDPGILESLASQLVLGAHLLEWVGVDEVIGAHRNDGEGVLSSSSLHKRDVMRRGSNLLTSKRSFQVSKVLVAGQV